MTKTFILLLALLLTACSDNSTKETTDRLWYNWESSRFLDALPLGNGRMGAMVYGGVETEKVGLNLSTFWSGGVSDNNDNKEAGVYLDSIRALFFAGELGLAEEMCGLYMLGQQNNYGTHLPMGSMNLVFREDQKAVDAYIRDLDLGQALASVHYTKGNTEYSREYLTSHPDQCLAIRLTASETEMLNFDLLSEWNDPGASMMVLDSRTLSVTGRAQESRHSDGLSGVSFETQFRIQDCDGEITSDFNGLHVTKASEATILVVSNTNFAHGNPKHLCADQLSVLADKTYQEIRDRHVEDHQALYDRVSLRIGKEDRSHIPTDVRLKELAEGKEDPQLSALFYKFGRYLLIASSREDSPLPGNLQGIWNDNFACRMPWTCDFHLDINTQQNYWIAETGNLSECHEPLFRFIEGLVEPGRRTARVMYNSPGWVTHVFSNAWGYTSPGWGLGWGLHVTGGIWIGSHLWHHYEYSGDLNFLKETGYPVLKEAAVFFKSYMVEHPEYGWLLTGPSLSPENKYFSPEGEIFSECMGPVCDAVLVRDLFSHCIEASEILGVDESFRAELVQMRSKLPPLQIGKYGQVMEWLEDYEEAVPNHRHTSHLIALFPSEQITPRGTPELAAAARVSIERRLGQSDWEDVEWSAGNMINFYARLGDGDAALERLHGLLTEDTDMNMMTFSRAGIAGAQENIFVLDGNTSGAGGISEMLLQSYGDTLYILPALPSLWPEGEVRGLRARGGFEVDLSWKEGEMVNLKILSHLGNQLRIKGPEGELSMGTEPGEVYVLKKSNLYNK